MLNTTTGRTGMFAKGLGAAAIIGVTTACATITNYDPTSYKTATDLKAEAVLLLGRATAPAAVHKEEIASVRMKLQQAVEYERGKGKLNSETVKQWELLADPNRNLLGSFLKKWEAKTDGFSEAYIEGKAKGIGQAFDEIIKLERHKVRK